MVLDAGTPGFSAQWGWIQPAIAEFATVVSYDRPGLGWSDPQAATRLLSTLGIRPTVCTPPCRN